MSSVYKLAFASAALPSRMIGMLNKKCLKKCMPKGLCEINSLSNEQYFLCRCLSSGTFVAQQSSKFKYFQISLSWSPAHLY